MVAVPVPPIRVWGLLVMVGVCVNPPFDSPA
jgi:hypothetical protein